VESREPSLRPAAGNALTISQVNRLGRRLRASSSLSSSDLELLQRLREHYFATLMTVQGILGEQMPQVPMTARLKTVQTIVDKLKRERSMALSGMRDIAGIRIVKEMNRVQQDVLIRDLRDTLGDGEVIDRRRRPSYGYRAVHVIVNVDGRRVEIQVRTRMQDQWAQIVERLGDRWGRQIRYGEPPVEPAAAISGVTRARMWGLVLRMSNVIDSYETQYADFYRAGDTELPAELAKRGDEILSLLGEIASEAEAR
jgi:Region found in RelA / SpoT proteins